MCDSILEHHLQVYRSKDVDSILEGFSEDSIIIIPNQVFKGLDQIRGIYENVTQVLFPEGSEFEVVEKTVVDNIGYLIWKAESDKYKINFASDTFVFENGKIKVQTAAFVLEEKK